MTIEKLAQDPNGAPDPISGAQPGSNPQFERSFSDLAYARLKDKAPKLLDYLVGFQVIEKNDDETKAAGVFCFKVGRQILYAPVFFIDGELKGHELLYIKEQDAFVPMQENWVNYILSRKPTIIGESGKGNEYEMGIRNPDFYAYRASPLRGFNKMSYADYDPAKADEIYGYWHSGEKFDITPIDRALCLSVNSPIFKAAAANCDLTKLIPALGVKAASVIVATIAARPDFAKALSKFYNGSNLMPKSASVEVPVTPPADAVLHANGLDRKLFGYYVKKLAAASNKAVLSGTDKAVVRILQSCGVKSAAYLPAVLDKVLAAPAVIEKAAASPAGKITIVTRKDPIPEDFSDDDVTQVITEGFVVRDDRSGDTKSKVYDINMTDSMTNPDSSGIYDMVSKDGKTYPVVIIKNPKTIGAGSANLCLVVRLDGKGWGSLVASDIFVRKDRITDWQPFYDKLPTVDTMKVGGSYMIVGHKGEGSLVVNVAEKDGDNVFVNVPCCHADYASIGPINSYTRMRPGSAYHENNTEDIATKADVKKDTKAIADDERKRWWLRDVRKIVITPNVHALKPVGDTLMVPSDYKVYDVKHDSARLDFAPANITDAELALIKQANLHPVTVWSDGLSYQIDDSTLSSRMPVEDATRALLFTHGVSKEAAKSMLKSASAKGVDTFLIKYAAGYFAGGRLTPGPDSPSIGGLVDGTQAYDPTIGATTEYGQERFEPYRLPVGSYADYDPYRRTPPKAQLGAGAVDTAISAANSGQKEVFDTSVLSGLVKTMDIDNSVDKYLSDLVVGEDRVGRLLFLYYWHNDKFAERYGEDEMQELEDGLRNTFKSVGDVVLFLKKKSIEPDMALQGTDVDLGDIS